MSVTDLAATCPECGTECTVDVDAVRMAGYMECPVCGDDMLVREAVETVDRGSIPLDVGDTIVDQGDTLRFKGWPTGGPLFEIVGEPAPFNEVQMDPAEATAVLAARGSSDPDGRVPGETPEVPIAASCPSCRAPWMVPADRSVDALCPDCRDTAADDGGDD